MKKLLLSLFIAFGFSACSLNNEDTYTDCGANTEVAFSKFALGCNYTVKTLYNNPVALIASSTEKMDQYFTKHVNSCSVPSDPNIDFSKNYLVAIFAGAKPTSGYDIKITSIVENQCEMIINFYEKNPVAGETLTQNPTYPADYILIPKTNKSIVFNKTNESPDHIVIGNFTSVSGGTQKFIQLNDFNILKFQNVVFNQYNFEQYSYTTTTKRTEYTTFSKVIPTEILNLKGQTKIYGSPNTAAEGGVYFELTQGASVTKVYIDNNDTADQSAAVIAFKKAVREKIAATN
ncbi:protease complex subunit PrcB family protein [Flavobacterium artemisiae]|uniref:Protease complex subunit PrcB family protein n=1 Tax=Flavobacterium artemisiae TaxID=2126556 RepID=A0ABW4H8Z5_9FLAO